TIMNYGDAHEGLMPVGTLANPQLKADQRLSWIVTVLPNWRENTGTRNSILTFPWEPTENKKAVEPDNGPSRCPPWREGNGAAINLTSYVGVAGIGQDAAALPLGDKRCGFFGYERKIRMPDDIKDGTSHTLVVIETGRDNGPWARGGSAT